MSYRERCGPLELAFDRRSSWALVFELRSLGVNIQIGPYWLQVLWGQIPPIYLGRVKR
jgi:hypothetical protein